MKIFFLTNFKNIYIFILYSSWEKLILNKKVHLFCLSLVKHNLIFLNIHFLKKEELHLITKRTVYIHWFNTGEETTLALDSRTTNNDSEWQKQQWKSQLSFLLLSVKSSKEDMRLHGMAVWVRERESRCVCVCI